MSGDRMPVFLIALTIIKWGNSECGMLAIFFYLLGDNLQTITAKSQQ